MGDIKKIKKKYSKPAHPWRATRIQEEKALGIEYGIPRRTEIWKMISKLGSFKNQAKSVAAVITEQGAIQRQNLFNRVESYNLVKKGDSLDVILGISLKDLLNRRLQTFVFKKNLARTMKQSRQLIIHRHILVNGKIITSPSYLVHVSEENSIEINPKSAFYDTQHPERTKEPAKKKEVRKVERPRGRRR